MDDNGSIVEFFYNIVPGSLFLILLNYLYQINIASELGFKIKDAALIIFIYIVLGLFLGFIFQGITKFVRNYFSWNIKMAKRVKDKNLDKFNDVYNKINNKRNKEVNLIPPEDILKTFYLMDAYLRGNSPAFLPTHFSSRFAFWANIFFGIIILIIFGLFEHQGYSLSIELVVAAFISFYFADQYFEGFYDSIFKSYFMLVKNGDIRNIIK